MSFLKGIFGKEAAKPPAPTPASAGKSAPPARPFPAGFSADGQSQQQSPASHAIQRRPSSAYDQQAYAPQQPAPATDEPAGDSGGGGMDDDLFAGMSVKVDTPSHAAASAAPQSAPGHAHTLSNGHVQPAPVAASASSGGGMDMDMFSGLTVASADAAPSGGAEDDAGSAGGSSLLSMLESGSSGSATDTSSEPSSFAFVSDSASAPAESESAGSSFSFLTSSSPVAPSDDAPQHDAYGAPATDRPLSLDAPSPSVSAHSSPSKPSADSHSSLYGASPSAPTGPVRKASSASAAPTFEQIHSQIDLTLTSYWDSLKSLSLTQSALRTQQLSLQAQVKSAQDQQGALEVSQQAEIEAENYDAADQLNSQLDALKAQLLNDNAQLQRITLNLADQERNKASLRSRTRAVLDECVSQLQHLSKQHTFNMTNSITSETQKLEQQEDLLITNLEKTRRNLAHTLQDLQSIGADEEKIAAQIAVDTAEMSAEQGQLQTQLMALEAERDELRRQLQAKEDEVTMCSQKIDVVATGIANKKASHEKKLARIHEKRTRTETERDEATRTEASLLAAKESLEADFRAVAAQEKNSTKRLKKMQEEAAFIQNVVAQKLAEAVAPVETAPDEASSSSSGSDGDVSALQARLHSTVASLDSTRAQLLSLDSQLDSLQKQVDSLAAKIPSLEVDKNLAVNTRDFKKAGVVSKEIKTLQTQKAEVETSMQELKAQVGALNAQLATLADTKATLTTQLVQVESEADKRALKTFLQQRIVLQYKNAQVAKLMRKNESEKADEAAAADPSSPSPAQPVSFALAHHFSYLSHEQSCNSVEVELLSKEIDELRKKHAWSDTFLQEDAQKELDARRAAAGEPRIVLAEDDETAPGLADLGGSSAPASPREEEASITEQRRKDRAAAAAAAEAEQQGGAAATEQPPADASIADASAAVANVPAEIAAASSSESSGEATFAPAESDATAPAEPAAEEAPAAESEPAGPAPLSEEAIAALRASYTAIVADIASTEAAVEAAAAAEDFEEADRLDTTLNEQRAKKVAIEEQAQKDGITLE